MKRIQLTFAAIAAALPLAAAAASGTILIGQSAPLTGSNAEIGKDIRDGAVAYGVWGAPGDRPVTADWDGDRQTDLAVYRP